MPYYINNSNGTSLVTIPDGEVDRTTTSLTLVGKNFPSYGQTLNQNFVNLLENFASTSEPNNPLIGQLWYDDSVKALKYYREGSTVDFWQKIATTSEGSTEPADARLGDLWWDTANSQLKLYDTNSSSWRVIGPQTTTSGSLRVTGNNNFSLQVGGNNTLIVDTFGGLTLPLNPCVFGASATVASNKATSGIGSFTTWIPTITTDRGSNFNTTTGIFTVRTPGIYQVYWHATTLGGGNGAGSNPIIVKWLRNGSDTTVKAANNHTNSNTQQLVCSGMVSASEGDTIQLVYATADGTTYIGYEYSHYSIQLVA